jgi:hypothetical protein
MEAFFTAIRMKLIKACGGSLPERYRQTMTNQQHADGSQDSMTTTLFIFDDITIGSIIERRTEFNYFEQSYSIYENGIAKIAERFKDDSHA